MAFSLVSTKASGDTITATNWNTWIRDNMNGMLYPPGCCVYNSTSISTGSGAFHTVTFNSEVFDNDGMHDLVTNTSRLTVQTAGLYAIAAAVNFAVSVSGIRTIQILKNGSEAIGYQDFSSANNCHSGTIAIPVVPLEVADYIELRTYQDTGSNLNLEYGASYSPFLSALWVGLS